LGLASSVLARPPLVNQQGRRVGSRLPDRID
jgi:hypothetical protein